MKQNAARRAADQAAWEKRAKEQSEKVVQAKAEAQAVKAEKRAQAAAAQEEQARAEREAARQAAEARRAELKTVTVTRFDEKACRDRMKKREEAEWLRKTESEKAKAIKQQKKEKKKEKDLKKNRKQFSLK